MADNDRSCGELRSPDRNISSLCDHIWTGGFESGAFSDVIVSAMGSTYHLHRLILSRSSYFRNMLHGPWKDATAPVVTLHVDDDNVNAEAMAMALAYLYGHHPKLNESNAFRVLAAASFLDLQDLCAVCTDFIISELWTSNFLAYQIFAESQDYGIYGERVRRACWGYLCQSGAVELREVLPKLSSRTLHALLTSDALWVPNEEKRFELALYVLLAKAADQPEEVTQISEAGTCSLESVVFEGVNMTSRSSGKVLLEPELRDMSLETNSETWKTSHRDTETSAVSIASFSSVHVSKPGNENPNDCSQEVLDRYGCNMKQVSSINNPFPSPVGFRRSSSYIDMQSGNESFQAVSCQTVKESSLAEISCCSSKNNKDIHNGWHPVSLTKQCSLFSCNPVKWGRCNVLAPSWGGRLVSRRVATGSSRRSVGTCQEDCDTFMKIFEGGSLLYCNMSFETLLNVRKQLEEFGFPCKAVNDGLWLQMLLNHKVQEIGAAETCRNCCLASMLCTCNHTYGFSPGTVPSSYYRQDRSRNGRSINMENVYFAETQGDSAGLYGPVHVQVRPIDGLAGIGRGTAFVPATAWPPTRFVFSRVPFGMGTKSSQQSPVNDELEARSAVNGDPSGDGLTALAGRCQGSSNISFHSEQLQMTSRPDSRDRLVEGSTRILNGGSSPMQMTEEQEHDLALEWEEAEDLITLDMRTPLCRFPPFRFGVEFEHVHMLTDGQVKHSVEVFYAGSLWKVSVQAFNEEDHPGHKTLGLFLHRRKAEMTDMHRKVHAYIDSREKVTARYQLICPSKREVLVFGSFEETGTLLPKAPKGWGWRTALLLDELPDLLQGGVLRIAAIVQLV